MSGNKYDECFVTELLHPDGQNDKNGNPIEWKTRVLFLNGKLREGAFFMSSCWYMKDADKADPAVSHTHDCDEVLSFIGSDPQNPMDLGGEVEMWVGGEKHIITKSCLLYVPKGVSHCPMFVRKVERPIFHFSAAAGQAEKLPVGVEPRTDGHAYDPNFVTKLEYHGPGTFCDWKTRVLFLDNKVLNDAFFTSVVWYTGASEGPNPAVPHRHNHPEILAFVSGDPNNPTDLGGEVEMYIEGERHVFDKSCMIYVPAGVSHCPMWAKRVDRPILHFTVIPSTEYAKIEDKAD